MRRDNVKVALFFVFISFVFTMSILMSIFFAFNDFLQKKKSSTPMYVFLSDNVSKSLAQTIANNILQYKGVRKVKLIDKKEAMNAMLKKFSIDKKLFGYNPFPYSIEIFFEPSFTTLKQFKVFKDKLNNPSIIAIKYPVDVLKEIETLHNRFIYFSRVVLSVLYSVEFIVFVSIMTIFYSSRKNDYDTLKFFGIKRFVIFKLFLKDVFKPVLSGVVFLIFSVVVFYVLYTKYGYLPYLGSKLFELNRNNMFVLNALIGMFFTFLSCLIVFVFSDEKI